MLKKFGFIIALVLLGGCATVQSTSLSNVTDTEGTRITSADSETTFLHLTLPAIDDITTNLLSRIQKNCEKGSLTNVQTTLAMRELLIIQFYNVQVTAKCVKK